MAVRKRYRGAVWVILDLLSPLPGIGGGPESHPATLWQNQRHQRQSGEIGANGE